MGDNDLKIDENTGIVLEETTIETPVEEEKEIPTVASVDESQREEKKKEIKEEVLSKQIELELKRGYREVEIEPYGKLHIYSPTIEDDYEGDNAYAEEISVLLIEEKLPTTEEMAEKLEKRGLWTPEHDDRLKDLQEENSQLAAEIIVLRADYKESKSVKLKNKINKLEDEHRKAKEEFLKLNAIKSKYFSFTVEGRAEEKRLVLKMSRSIRKPDGTKLWESAEKLQKEKNREPVSRLVYEYITFTQGIDPRVLERIPDLLDKVGDVSI